MSILSDFEEISISKIKVGKRFREDPGEVSSLVESMSDIGLLHAIGITLDDWLVYGLRRLTAAKELSWEKILVRRLPFKHEELLNHERR
ncbi:MAG: ParB N-terminal domain-containing protein [Thaumarchaeota archaeon]|nr:ParB N-terminal domain-containing protein [Nitrososphaerota archaeon]